MNKLTQLGADIAKLWGRYGGAYITGMRNTLLLALIGTLIGCLIGFICGVLNTIPYTKSDHPLKRFVLRLIRVIIRVYVEVFRGTPMVLQAVFLYYGLPYFTDNAVRFTSIWLASIPRRYLSPLDQVLAVQNFQNAAHYDLRTVKIVMPELRDEAAASAEGAALYLLDRMRDFYLGIREDIPDWVPRVLEFERKKIVHPETRYAARAREQFSGTFLEKGMERAVSLQEECCCCRK